MAPAVIAVLAFVFSLPASAYYVCAARPTSVPPWAKPHVVQGHGFLRPDAERAVLARCAELNGATAECIVTTCTQYEL